MTYCPACTEALANRWCGMYHADCRECSARALSHSPMYFAADSADAMTPAYRDALQALFGADWIDGHAMVKRWAERRNP